MLELYNFYVKSITNCQYPNIPVTQQINNKIAINLANYLQYCES